MAYSKQYSNADKIKYYTEMLHSSPKGSVKHNKALNKLRQFGSKNVSYSKPVIEKKPTYNSNPRKWTMFDRMLFTDEDHELKFKYAKTDYEKAKVIDESIMNLGRYVFSNDNEENHLNSKKQLWKKRKQKYVGKFDFYHS